MRIDLYTLPLHINYGGILQCYALQTVLQRMGHEVVVLNRRGPKERLSLWLFLLRCVELGISVRDLELLTIGLILDMWTEKDNDSVTYDRAASQEDFDRF